MFALALTTPVVAATQSAGAVTPAISCYVGSLSETGTVTTLRQSTHYCVETNGANVWSIAAPTIIGGATSKGVSQGWSYTGTTPTVQNECYSYGSDSRGYCTHIVTNINYRLYHQSDTGGGFGIDILGTGGSVSASHGSTTDETDPLWTEMVFFYNGYCEYADSYNYAKWRTCTSTSCNR